MEHFAYTTCIKLKDGNLLMMTSCGTSTAVENTLPISRVPSERIEHFATLSPPHLGRLTIQEISGKPSLLDAMELPSLVALPQPIIAVTLSRVIESIYLG
jgi:hypothetical protein